MNKSNRKKTDLFICIHFSHSSPCSTCIKCIFATVKILEDEEPELCKVTDKEHCKEDFLKKTANKYATFAQVLSHRLLIIDLFVKI
jgi:hypothetical protein